MDREEVLDAMCEAVNEMNRQIAWQNGIPSDQIEDTINKMQEELRHGNSFILDKLIDIGAIADLG